MIDMPFENGHILKTIEQAHRAVADQRALNHRIGIVPTMGALHAGHLSLVEQAVADCDSVIVTIFVNPTQFAPDEDYERYPRSLEADVAALKPLAPPFVFAPDLAEIYPDRATTSVRPPAVAQSLEGQVRPDHFGGVATIVLKLFQILRADVAYFGLKDYQQCLVIRDMVRDLNVPIGLKFCPTIRESDDLALSSRNRYLSPAERKTALSIPQSLRMARQLIAQGERSAAAIEASVARFLREAGVDSIDYVAVRDSETLEERERFESSAILLVAAHVGSTRLIDNTRLL